MIKKSAAVAKVLATLLIFLIPTQFALHLWPSYALVYGIRVDYLAPTVFLTDLLLLALLTIWFLADGKFLKLFAAKNKKILAIILTLAVLNIIFSTQLLVSLFKWAKFLEISLFGLYIFRNTDTLLKQNILKTLYLSLVFYAGLGILQFLSGHTIGGAFYFFGERTFSATTPGIALFSLFGKEYIRAYSVFPHPNSLAGYFGGSLILLLTHKILWKSFFGKLGYAVIILGFFLSFSLAAFLAMTVAFSAFVLLRNKNNLSQFTKAVLFFSIFASLALPLVAGNISPTLYNTGEKITGRLDLAYLSGKMFSEKFLFGQGLNTFTFNLSHYKTLLPVFWLLQPVHNIFLLILAETGLAGFFVFSFLLLRGAVSALKVGKAYLLVFLFILITGLFDHYWLTQQQNMFLIALAGGLMLH